MKMKIGYECVYGVLRQRTAEPEHGIPEGF